MSEPSIMIFFNKFVLFWTLLVWGDEGNKWWLRLLGLKKRKKKTIRSRIKTRFACNLRVHYFLAMLDLRIKSGGLTGGNDGISYHPWWFRWVRKIKKERERVEGKKKNRYNYFLDKKETIFKFILHWIMLQSIRIFILKSCWTNFKGRIIIS